MINTGEVNTRMIKTQTISKHLLTKPSTLSITSGFCSIPSKPLIFLIDTE